MAFVSGEIRVSRFLKKDLQASAAKNLMVSLEPDEHHHG